MCKDRELHRKAKAKPKLKPKISPDETFSPDEAYGMVLRLMQAQNPTMSKAEIVELLNIQVRESLGKAPRPN